MKKSLSFLMLLFVVGVMVLITAVLSVSYEVFDELRANSHLYNNSVLK